MTITIYFFILCFCSATINGQENPQVKTSDGKVKGKILKTKEGREFSAFQGIPYAEPPLGQLRFKSPVPIKPWNGILDATHPHEVCPQNDVFGQTEAILGDENCLFLNIYTPQLPSESTELLPVMVYLHGGGFYHGGGNFHWYSPEILLDRDIVLVITNYRLGALGFLSTGDEVSPGNYGLKDQSLALKWVNKNIQYFGGDPNSVTIFGESAGGASVNYHMLSPLSKGLFKGAISMSGTSFCTWAFSREGENSRNARILGEAVGCPTSSSKELVECLKNIDPIELVKKDSLFMNWDVDVKIPFKPVVEAPSPEAFLTDSPANLFKAGKFHDVPWMTGVSKEEGLIRAAAFAHSPEAFDELNQDFEDRGDVSSFIQQSDVEDYDKVMDDIKKFYFGNKEKLYLETDFTNLVNMYTDAWLTKCLDDSVRAHLKVAKKPVYNYLFAYKGGASISQIFGDPEKVYGASHGDDLMYLFSTDNLFPNKNITEDDKKITKLLTTLWENFAKTGNPTPDTNDLIAAKWQPTKTEKLEYYHIDANEQGMRGALFEERVNFWRSLPFLPKKLTKREEL